MRIVIWVIRALLFLLLFLFALNNQHTVELRGFFGAAWHTPMIFVVLSALISGAALGVLAMMPSWWRQRRLASQRQAEIERLQAPTSSQAPTPPPSVGADAMLPAHVREGI